jgi:SAM-dependent methyltransferase
MNVDPVAWTALPAVQLRLNVRSSGRSDMGWHAYCLSLLDRALLGRARMLVLGRESLWLERDLERRNVFERCDVAEANDAELPPAEYDVVWCDQTLCRVADLERAVARIARALRPGGFLFAYEYVGAARLAIGRMQREAVRAAFLLVPRRYRIAPSGALLTDVALPSASGSETPPPIVRTLREHFEFADYRPLGGTLLQYVLKDIAGSFLADDRAAVAVLEMLFAIEDALIDSGELESDFALIVAKPK